MGNPLWFNLLRYVSFPASRFDAGKNSHRRDLDCVGVAISPVGSACIQKNGRRSNPICANDRRRGRTFVESSRDRIRALQGDLSRDVRTEHQWPRSNCVRKSDMLRRIRREISNKRRNRFWYRWIHSWPELQRKPFFRSLRESSNDSTCIDPLASRHQILMQGRRRRAAG